MHTFTNRTNPCSFWVALVLPPLGFWLTFVWLSEGPLEQSFSSPAFWSILFLAHAFPLAALIWTLFSICACSVSPGQLVIHRVVFDREWPLSAVRNVARIGSNIVRLELGNRHVLLRPDRPEEFVNALSRFNIIKYNGEPFCF